MRPTSLHPPLKTSECCADTARAVPVTARPGKEKRIAEFGSSKQWKTLSADEAFEQYYVRRRDVEGLPFVAKYNVYGAPRHTRFYVLFDVQDAALERWGSAEALQDAIACRRAKRARRLARLQPPVLMLLRPVRARKGEVNVGSRAVFAAIAGNSGVAAAKLAGWAATGAPLSHRLRHRELA